MPKNLDELRIDLEQAVQQATNVQNVAAAEGRELTEDDKAVMAAAMDRQDALAADIALMERVQASVRSIEAGRGPRTAPNPPAVAGRKNRIGASVTRPSMVDTSTPTASARCDRRNH